MSLRNPIILGLSLLFAAGAAIGENLSRTENSTQEIPVDRDATLVIKNPVGNIEIIGTDSRTLTIGRQRVVTGVDQAALKEALDGTKTEVDPSSRAPVIQTVIKPVRGRRWASVVHYTIHVPRTVNVQILSHSSDRLRLMNMTGDVKVNNINGMVVLDNVTGSVSVESINGDIVFDPTGKLLSNVALTTVNGQIELVVQPNAAFQWEAETIGGDLLTTLTPNTLRGRFDGSEFHAIVNSPRGPKITTAAAMGKIFVLKKGTRRTEARSLRPPHEEGTPGRAPRVGPLLSGELQLPIYQGDFFYERRIGRVSVGQVRGSATVVTGAGEIQFGIVQGQTTITSDGGPLDLGDLFGRVSAETKAGDITVRAARQGGSLTTGGGVIRVLYAGGPMKLKSGGGDIIIRQASDSVAAETSSGDITINVEPNVRSTSVDARTAGGNITLNVNPQFAADIEAIVITSEEQGDPIRSDLPGLTIQREQVGNRTRVRATGKVNGGGERVELSAENGVIRITGQSVRPWIGPVQPQ